MDQRRTRGHLGEAAKEFRSIRAARHREIERLMHMLQNNPEEGLRYALPVGGDLSRGIAIPGTQLMARVVDFFNRGGLGGPADVWDIGDRYRRQLTEKYSRPGEPPGDRPGPASPRRVHLRPVARRLARRSQNFSPTAATIAKRPSSTTSGSSGRSKRRNASNAAGCSPRPSSSTTGSGSTKLGDLYVQLSQPDDAAPAYRRAVQQLLTASDRLGAAKLLEDKLHAPEEAWCSSPGAGPIRRKRHLLESRLRVDRAGHGDFARARQHLQHVTQATRSSSQVVTLVQQTSELAINYPEASLREAAAETTLTVASPRLPAAHGIEMRALKAAIQRLEPADRLLARDCERYQQTPVLMLSGPRGLTPLAAPRRRPAVAC